MEVVIEALCLGILMGPTASGRRWDRAIRTFVDRTRLIGALSSGWGTLTVLYNLLAVSVISYVAQFEDPPPMFRN